MEILTIVYYHFNLLLYSFFQTKIQALVSKGLLLLPFLYAGIELAQFSRKGPSNKQ
jgi:hypothetical protein